MKKTNIADYGYEENVQTAYLNEEVGKMVDAVYGERLLERFKQERLEPYTTIGPKNCI